MSDAPDRTAKVDLEDRSRFLTNQTVAMLRHTFRAAKFDELSNLSQSFAATGEPVLNNTVQTMSSLEVVLRSMNQSMDATQTSLANTSLMVTATNRSITLLTPLTQGMSNKESLS
eukprot:c27560_g1_i1.p1 GENE.c27560_g1_i1~~c27560_g1_i1.p1  ORF type:complete len:126 (-),score=26.79 c27560_g1_i1:46-390(-)